MVAAAPCQERGGHAEKLPPPMQILLIDDDPAFAQTLGDHLAAASPAARLEHKVDLAEARSALAAGGIAAVAVRLAALGAEAPLAVLGELAGAGAPVVVLASGGAALDRAALRRAGAFGVVEKHPAALA
jgi:DNA-binding response OmpR family regulator